MAQHVLKAHPRCSWRSVSSLVSPTSRCTRARLKPSLFYLPRTSLRLYHTSDPRQDYPQEGVFQPNSPPRRSQQPVSNVYFPQISPQPSPRYSPEPEPRLPSSSSWSSLLLSWALRTAFFVSVTAYIALRATELALTRVPLHFAPGSPEDTEELQLLAEELDALPLVQDLRSMYHIDPITNERVRIWREWVAYRGFSDPTSTSASIERRENMLSTGPLKGSQGLAGQAVFYNEQSGQVIVIVNFGAGCCGLPGQVSVGAVETIMDEGLGRVAAKSLGRDMREAARAGPDANDRNTAENPEKSVVTAELSVNHYEYTQPGQWFVLVGLPEPMGRDGIGKMMLDERVGLPEPMGRDGIGKTMLEEREREWDFHEPGSPPLRGITETNELTPPAEPSVSTPTPSNPPTQPSLAPPNLDFTFDQPPAPDPSPFSVNASTGVVPDGAGQNGAGYEPKPTQNANRKKYATGVLFCASELGPTFIDLQVYLRTSNSTDLHVHALGAGLWVVKEGIKSPPEEF